MESPSIRKPGDPGSAGPPRFVPPRPYDASEGERHYEELVRRSWIIRSLDEVAGFLATLIASVLLTLILRPFFLFRIIGAERFRDAYRRLVRPAPGTKPEPLVVAWNHRTLLDSYLFVWAFFWPSALWTWLRTGRNPLPYHAANAWNYFDNPFKRFCARHWHILPVKRMNGEQKDGLIVRRLVRSLQTHVVHIFPQGRRARSDDEMIIPPPGTGQVVILSGATVLPMWVQGMRNVQDSHIPGHHTYRIRPRPFRRITIIVGSPLRFDPSRRDYQAISQEILDAIIALRPRS